MEEKKGDGNPRTEMPGIWIMSLLKWKRNASGRGR